MVCTHPGQQYLEFQLEELYHQCRWWSGKTPRQLGRTISRHEIIKRKRMKNIYFTFSTQRPITKRLVMADLPTPPTPITIILIEDILLVVLLNNC